jgi:hypothetical protein
MTQERLTTWTERHDASDEPLATLLESHEAFTRAQVNVA